MINFKKNKKKKNPILQLGKIFVLFQIALVLFHWTSILWWLNYY